MHKLYRAALWLYPGEYRAAFANEMQETLEQGTAQNQELSAFARFRFALYEATGLVKGACRERIAMLTHGREYLRYCRPLQMSEDLPRDVVGLQKRVYELIRLMELAIAHHDFAKARFYSNEERAASVALERLIADGLQRPNVA